ncbi:MAG TPA: contact-dependent growth inhibition system immunity protein [Terriglobales bacterium]|nr:contact-dependent growth inhibition system immunity protein [Terriglobales bacterium]
MSKSPSDDSKFPALREFLRGYFHEDLAGQYGSPKDAARQFAQDADVTQRHNVAEELLRFMHENRHRPLPQINELLRALGSAWNFDSPSDLEEIEHILRHH